MNTTLKAPKALLLPAILAFLVLILTFVLAGCVGSAKTPATSAPAAEPVAEQPEPQEGILAFGEVFTYENGVSISVSEGVPFVPTASSAGAVEGNTHLAFTIVLTNGTAEAIDPYTYETVSSGGKEGSSIFDMDNSIGDIGGSPMTSLLPGDSATWIVGYSVVDPLDVVFEAAPGFEYEEVIFTNAQ